MFTPEDIMWASEIAKLAGVKVETIRGSRWKKKSRFPLLKRGKKLYAIRSEVCKWVKGEGCDAQVTNG